MNQVFKVVFSEVCGMFVVGSELIKSRGKSKAQKTAVALAAVALMGMAGYAGADTIPGPESSTTGNALWISNTDGASHDYDAGSDDISGSATTTAAGKTARTIQAAYAGTSTNEVISRFPKVMRHFGGKLTKGDHLMQKINTQKTSNFFNPNITYRGIGIDIAKNFLSVCTIDDDGAINYHAKMSREELIKQLAPLKPTRIVMEPCAGSAELAERIRMIGHTPILVSGSTVKAAVLAQCNGQKNDRNDALVMARMACDPMVRSAVIPKHRQQRLLAALLAQRNVLVTNRTRIINSTKGRLLEAGVALNRADINGRELAQKLPEDVLVQQMVSMDRDVIGYLTSKIEELDELIKGILSEMPETQVLQGIPGFGHIATASFLDPHRFQRGNSLCAYLGMVPQDISSGGKTRLGHMSKRGNGLLRWLMVNAGLLLMRMVNAKESKVPDCRLKDWVLNQIKKHGSNKKPFSLKAAVACGCKLVRTALSLMKSGSTFDWMKAGVSSR